MTGERARKVAGRGANVLIILAYAPTNIGDGAIVLAMIDQAKRVFGPGTRVAVSATDPDAFRSLLGIDAHHRLVRWEPMGRPLACIAWLARSAPALLSVWWATGGRARMERASRSAHIDPRTREALRAYLEADVVLACGGGRWCAARVL